MYSTHKISPVPHSSLSQGAALPCMEPLCMLPYSCQIGFDLVLDAALHQPDGKPDLHNNVIHLRHYSWCCLMWQLLEGFLCRKHLRRDIHSLT